MLMCLLVLIQAVLAVTYNYIELEKHQVHFLYSNNFMILQETLSKALMQT